MKRDISTLESTEFDIVVVGGGIYGACIARDAALRGLSVALVEKSDFSSGTSHNSLKLIHGGIRYFQHFDFRRVRQSLLERRFWLAKAPHLVNPVEFTIPTFGHLARGPIALAAASILHRMLGFDWNKGVCADKRIEMGKVLSREEFSERVPGIPLQGVSGAATWTDGQMSDADRIVLECIESAALNGGVVANYVRADEILRESNHVVGVMVSDALSGRKFTVRSRFVVNSCGPWAGAFLKESLDIPGIDRNFPLFSKNMNVVTRRFDVAEAFGVASARSGDGLIGEQNRLYFVTPWKNVTIIGTTHFPFSGHPEDYAVSSGEISDFIAEINAAYPSANLQPDDVLYVYSGLTPTEEGDNDGEVVRTHHSDLIDHEELDDLAGLVTVIGVKFTTARLVAEQTVDFVCRKFGVRKSGRLARETSLPGADSSLDNATLHSSDFDDDAFAFLHQYGLRKASVVGRLQAGERIGFEDVFRHCVRHAVRQEMAMNLDDVVFRRTDLAVRGLLTPRLLDVAADEMQVLLEWSDAVTEAERRSVTGKLRYLP